MEVRPELANASSPILVTLLGMLMEVRFEHPENAVQLIFVTLLGMIIEVRFLHPENAALPILVTLLGISVYSHPLTSVLSLLRIIASQSFLLS